VRLSLADVATGEELAQLLSSIKTSIDLLEERLTRIENSLPPS
jgi:uncharacterized protein YPO0396